MTETTNLALPYIAPDQAQPEIPHNAALDLLDAAVGPVIGPLGSFVRLEAIEATLDLATDTAVTDMIPDRAIVLGLTSWVIDEITGATSYDVGHSAGDEFGGNLGTAAGSQNIGVIGPTAFYADTDVTVTANGGAFTGGTLGLSLAILRLGLDL